MKGGGEQNGTRAVYMRGGTSRALVFHRRDLPAAEVNDNYTGWNPLFLAALGSPDPGGRQLDGLGGGISSLSKIAVVEPCARPDADVSFTFAQVSIASASVGYRGTCGNISSAIGPFAVQEGLVDVAGQEAVVRIFNTNTAKILHASFPIVDGEPAVHGDFAIQGVAGTAAPIRLDFLEPGGAVTGRLLPTGAPCDELEVAGLGTVNVSLIDAGNPCAFLDASAFVGKSDDELTNTLDRIRVAAAVRMGVARDAQEARSTVANLPLVGLLSPGDAGCDIGVRMLSGGQLHKAVPLTGAMCLAIAARIQGSIAAILSVSNGSQGLLRVRHPTGILPVEARVSGRGAATRAESATVFRTARRLMEGRVFVPRKIVLKIAR